MSNPSGSGTRDLTFTYHEQEANITYLPEVARQQLDALRSLSTLDLDGQEQVIIGALEQMLDSWDFVEGEQPLPITADTLRNLSYFLLLRLVNEILRDLGESFELRLEVR